MSTHGHYTTWTAINAHVTLGSTEEKAEVNRPGKCKC
jgi:hypothetical protein